MNLPSNRRAAKRFVRLIVGLSILLTACLARAVDTQPADAKKDQPTPLKPKPDFEPLALSVVPQKADKNEANLRFVKPGHWIAATAEAKTNNFDFLGTLDAEVKPSPAARSFTLDRTMFDLAITRPAILPKGQPKFLDFLFYVPRQAERAWIATELRTSGGSLAATPGPEPLSLLKPYQFFLLVLAADADRYRPLEALDSVRAPHGGEPLQYYRVIAPALKKPLGLPSNPLAWTTIANLVWDDVDPELLTAEQQQALIDWLHFGGQLIISGPKSLDQLASANLLYPFLPAAAGEPVEITDETLRPLNDAWTLPVKKTPGRALSAGAPWSGIGLRLTAGAEFIPGTADLVAERRVGRGRIVVTGFRLSQRELWNWPGFDGFFNACLLGRPPRRFSTSEFATLSVNWADSAKPATDPTWISQVRFSSRAIASADSKVRTDEPDSMFSTPNSLPIEIPTAQASSWNDFNDVSNAARQSLIEAAGIVIPEPKFVVLSTLAYLFVLVPLNWLVFRAIGRVEWAWLAAPVIAVGAMAVVVKVAQLDIGFARSQTEIRVLETFSNYGRAHLTRYTALYTSLSTTYDVHSDNPTTLVLPFPAADDFTPLAGQTPTMVTYSSVPSVSLLDFTVASNSTGMLHSEQMIDLGGSYTYRDDADEPILKNSTRYPIHSGLIIRRARDGAVQASKLRGFAGEHVDYEAADAEHLQKLCERVFVEVLDASQKVHFNLAPLAKLLAKGDTLKPGETRLIGLCKTSADGLEIDPAASQTPRGVTLVVVHLTEPSLAEPVPDKNTRGDVTSTRADLFEGEALP